MTPDHLAFAGDRGRSCQSGGSPFIRADLTLEGINVTTEKSRIQYVVVAQQGLWKVRRDGKFYGPYPSREGAMASAINAAHMSGTNDRAAQVLSQGEDGETIAEWTFGLDAYPPQGAPVGTISFHDSTAPVAWGTAQGRNRLASTVLAWSRSWAPL